MKNESYDKRRTAIEIAAEIATGSIADCYRRLELIETKGINENVAIESRTIGMKCNAPVLIIIIGVFKKDSDRIRI